MNTTIRYYVATESAVLQWRVRSFATRAERDAFVARALDPAACLTWSNRSAA